MKKFFIGKRQIGDNSRCFIVAEISASHNKNLKHTLNLIREAKKSGISDLNKKYELNEIIKGDSIFCATAITDCLPISKSLKEKSEFISSLKGIKNKNDLFITETIVTHKSSKKEGIIRKEISLNNAEN